MRYLAAPSERQKGLAMRVQGVVIALMLLLSNPAGSIADPVTVQTPRHAMSQSWSLHLDEQLTALGIIGFGNEARYGRWEASFLSTADNWLDDLTLHGESRVVQLRLDVMDLPGHQRQFTFLLLPQQTNEPEWSFDGQGGMRHPGIMNKDAKKAGKEDRCNGNNCPTSVPEPASAALLAMGVGVTAIMGRRHRKL